MKIVSCSFILFFSTVFCSVAYALDSASADLKLFNKAVRMSADGNWSGAEKIFRDVAQNNPGWPEPKNNLAIVLYNAGKFEQARQSLDEAVSSLPSFKVAQDNRQRLYDYLAAIAYNKVVDVPKKPERPRLELLKQVHAQSSATTSQAMTSQTMSSQARPAVTPSAVSQGARKVVDIERQVNNSLRDWLKSWSSADVESYLSKYSSSFQPAELGKSYQQWRLGRTNRLRFGKIGKVTADAVEVYVDSSRQHALAQFVQHYRSSTYQDKVIKQLELTLEKGRWLIRSERVLQQLQ